MHVDCGKILGTFFKYFHVHLLEIETSPKKIRGIEKESFTFGQNVMNELAFGKTKLRFFNAKVR